MAIHRLKFSIDPVPASRPRVTSRGWSYYAKPYAHFKDALKKLAENAWTADPIAGEFFLSIRITCQRPKTSKLACPKPDVDNYAKAVMDACNEVVWVDDSGCRGLDIEKFWGSSGEIEMTVYTTRVEWLNRK